MSSDGTPRRPEDGEAPSPEQAEALESSNQSRRVIAWRAVAHAETLAGRPRRAELALRVADEIERTGSASEESIEDFERDLENAD
jgi:hypothetical protein